MRTARRPQPSSRRVVAAGLAAVLIHLAVLALLLNTPARSGLSQPRDVEISLTDRAGSYSPPATVSAPLPTAAIPLSPRLTSQSPLGTKPPEPISPEPMDLSSRQNDATATAEPMPLTPAIPSSATSAEAPVDRCRVLELVQKALQANEGVVAAVARTPPASRAMASAILIWNGRWVDPAKLGGAATLDPIRSAITDAVRATPQVCRVQTQHGPRLIAIQYPGGAVTLVLGTGAWTWSDLSGDLTELSLP